jgi:myosin heavy subunit
VYESDPATKTNELNKAEVAYMYYVVDIVLFLLALFVIIFYRFLDRKDRQIHLVKAYIDRMKQEVTAKEKSLQATFSQIEDDLQVRERSVRSLLKRIDQSLEELEQHAGDLNELQSYMSHYHRILKELSLLTEKAEKRMSLLQQHYDQLEGYTQRVQQLRGQQDTLSRDIGELNEKFEQQLELLDTTNSQEFRRHLDTLLSRAESKLSNLSKAFESEYDNAMEALGRQMDSLIQQAQESIETFTEQAAGTLERQRQSSRGDRSSVPLVPWSNNGISREVSQAAAELYNKDDEGSEHTRLFDEMDHDEHEDIDSGIMDQPDETEHVPDEDHEIFDEVDLPDEPEPRILTEDDEQPEEEDESSEDHALFDEIDLGEDSPADEIENDDDDAAEDEDEEDEEPLDRIYYEEDEPILFDDQAEDEHGIEDDVPPISPDKRRIVEEHLKEGFSIDEIQELTDIPKGEIELIRELLEYS